MYGCCYADASAVKNYVLKTGRIKLVVINGVMLGMLIVAPEIRYYYRSDLNDSHAWSAAYVAGPHYRWCPKSKGFYCKPPID